MLIVVDTNCVVSWALSPTGAPAAVLRRWRTEAFDLAVSETILTEYERALNYEHVRRRHRKSTEEVREAVGEFREFAVLVEPTETPAIISADPDDDKFLWCAVTAGAAFVVSGDKHLLALRTYHGIRILSPTAFLTLLDEEATNGTPPDDPHHP